MNEKAVVFISSTARDLGEYRSQVMEACLRADMVPRMMEHLPAVDADAVHVAMELLDNADVYIGLFAHRYGYIPRGYDVSIAQIEYERAVERGIPRLIFLMDDSVPVPVAEVDFENYEKLDRLKNRLKQDQVVAFFRSPDDLRALVLQGLVQVKTSFELAKQQRASSAKSRDPHSRKLLRIFVASPSDVRDERAEMPDIVKSLNRTLGKLRNVVVELWRWEDDAVPGVGEPQALIDPELDQADAVVVIFWNRFGLETTTGETGTEREVLRAFKRWEQQGRPQILIYFCKRPKTLDKEETRQRLSVLEFRDKLSSAALAVEYDDVSDFKWRVRDDLFLTLEKLAD